MHIVSLQDFGDPRDKVKYNETKIQHLVPYTMIVYTTVQNKT